MLASTAHRPGARSSVGSSASRLCAVLPRKDRPQDCCFTPDSPLRKPDPALYSQVELLRRATASGNALAANVSWNNPDIELYSGTPARLRPEARIIVHNRSPSVSAAGVRVDVYAYRFGIGYPRELIGGSLLSIDAGGQAPCVVPLPQQIIRGEQRIGLEVRLTHTADENAANNVGLHACQVVHTSAMGRGFDLLIPMRNDAPLAREMYLVPQGTTDLFTVFPPSAGPFAPYEERMVAMGVNARAIAPGAGVVRELHFKTLIRDAAGVQQVLEEGVSFLINIDA